MKRILYRLVALLLVLGLTPLPALANVFTTPDFYVITPNLSDLTAVEGSGPCSTHWTLNGTVGCDSLNMTFTFVNTSTSILTLYQAGGGATFLSGDASDSIVNSTQNYANGGVPACFNSLQIGGTCSITLNYVTSPVSEQTGGNFDSGVSWTTLSVGDQFTPRPWTQNSPLNANMNYQMTVTDSAPEPGSLALMLAGGIALVGFGAMRRKGALGHRS